MAKKKVTSVTLYLILPQKQYLFFPTLLIFFQKLQKENPDIGNEKVEVA